ncbi:SRPBCC family protein [Saccharomonospora sp. NPDC006951]
MIDIANELKVVYREVRERQDAGEPGLVCVLLRRRYPVPVGDVWNALTEPARLERWFLPVSGDLREGGTFAAEGNADGTVLQCEQPYLLRLTWGEAGVVELRLGSEDGDDTVLELEHTVPLSISGSGAGALYVGPGWDVTLLGLDQYVRGVEVGDPGTWESSEDVQKFSQHTVSAWASAIENSGTATAEEIGAAREVSLAQFAPDVTA